MILLFFILRTLFKGKREFRVMTIFLIQLGKRENVLHIFILMQSDYTVK